MIAIADYDTGNLRSVSEALRRAGAEFVVTSDIGTLRRADKVILPGVGEASASMARLRERGLDTVLPTLTCPVLGICVGLQLMCRSSDEGGGVDCMGIFPVRVVRLPEATPEGRWKVPHMGWNGLHFPKDRARSPIFADLNEGDHVYFVHSFAGFNCGDIAVCCPLIAINRNISKPLLQSVVQTAISFVPHTISCWVRLEKATCTASSFISSPSATSSKGSNADSAAGNFFKKSSGDSIQNSFARSAHPSLSTAVSADTRSTSGAGYFWLMRTAACTITNKKIAVPTTGSRT